MNSSFWNQKYSAVEYLYGCVPNDFLKASYSLIPDGPVLSLAEGEGRNACFLASLGKEVTGVDFSVEAVKKAQKLAQSKELSASFIHADLAEYDPGKDRWAAIVSIFAHTNPSLRKVLHRKVIDALLPGGVFILEAYHPKQVGRGTGGPADPHFCMTTETLREELQGLDILHLRELSRNVVEGTGHTGEASVVQCVGRKP
jgi:SAM-dependent methyltransferase